MRTVSAVSVALLAASSLPAQVSTIPEIGTRIRIESSAIVGRSAAGTLLGMNQGLVTFAIGRRGTRMIVPWSRIDAVSVVTGHDARRGALLGAFIGAGAALVVYPYEGPDPFEPLAEREPNQALVAAALALPVVGALVGSRFGPPVWQPLTWRPSMDTVLLEGEALRLDLVPNAKVLVRANDRWVKGRLVSDDAQTLTVDASGRRHSLSWSDIGQVNIAESRSRLRGAVLGATLGAAYAIYGLVNDRDATVAERQRRIALSVGAATAIGELIGRGSWTRVPIPAR